MVKHRNAPSVTRKRGASIAGQETVVARLTRERDEALLRETANSDFRAYFTVARRPGIGISNYLGERHPHL